MASRNEELQQIDNNNLTNTRVRIRSEQRPENPDVSRKVKSAEIGKTAQQPGVSRRAPIDEQIHFNASADFRSGMATWNLSLGWRHDFSYSLRVFILPRCCVGRGVE